MDPREEWDLQENIKISYYYFINKSKKYHLFEKKKFTKKLYKLLLKPFFQKCNSIKNALFQKKG